MRRAYGPCKTELLTKILSWLLGVRLLRLLSKQSVRHPCFHTLRHLNASWRESDSNIANPSYLPSRSGETFREGFPKFKDL